MNGPETTSEKAKEALAGQIEELIASGFEREAIDAYLEAGISDDLKDFEEAYSGKFDSDKEFAQDMAEQVGDIPKDLHWPYTCIDWEWAGRELMYDYTEQNGYYFRNL